MFTLPELRVRAAITVASVIGTTSILVACGDSAPKVAGNPAVYERIQGMSDCTGLQGEFDTAMNNAEARQPGDEARKVSLAYAKAADERLKALGCYGSGAG